MRTNRHNPILRTLLTAVLLLSMLTTTVLAANDTPIVGYDPADSFKNIVYGRSALGTLDNSTALLYAYDAIAKGVENATETITVYDGTNPISEEEITLVMDTYIRDYAHHFWLGNGYSYSYNSQTVIDILPSYLLSGSELTAAKAAFDAAEEEILAGIDDDMTEFEIELYLHDTLADMVEYTEATHAHNAYGALVEGKAVCEGYAEAFQHLLQRAGIQSFIVTGNSRGEGHEWNIVNIDGQWYHVDLTWDDQGSELFHAYLNVSDDIINEGHILDETPYALPECDSMEANYFTVKGGSVTSFDAEELGAMMAEQDLSAHVYLTGDETTVEEYLADYMTESNILQIAEAAGVTGSFSYSYSYLGREMVLTIIPAGVSASITAQRTDSVTVMVRANPAQTGNLYIAVYAEDGRMIGIEEVLSASLTVSGSRYTIDFEGTADLVKVFTPNGSYIPTDAAIELNVG